MSNENPQPPGDPGEFASLLMQHAKGRAHDEATRKLQDAVEAVKRTGKAANVTVKLSIHPVKNNDTVVRIEDKVTSSIPEDTRSSMWFATEEGSLHRNDPKQIPMWGSGSDNPDRNHEPIHQKEA